MAHIGGPSSQLALLRVLPFAAAYAIVGCLVFGFAGVQAQVQTDVVDPNHGSTAVFALLAGDTVVKNDGQYALCSASGIMWHEIDGDGTLAEDPKQHGIGGVPIQLYWANGTLSETTKTKGDGSYIFKIEPGSYYVHAACPKEYKQYTTPLTKVDPITQVSEIFSVGTNKAVTGINIACYKPPTIEGVVFSDKNTNSDLDNDERGIEGVAVELTKSSDTSFRLKAFTDPEGRFRFSDLELADYKLELAYDSAYFTSPTLAQKESTSSEGGKIRRKSVPLQASEPKIRGGKKVTAIAPLKLLSGDHANIKQGLYTLAKVEGVVFRDENANGIWDAGESVLPSVTTTLYRAGDSPSNDVVVSQMKSDEAGRYSFKELQPGRYYVIFDTSSPEYKHSSPK